MSFTVNPSFEHYYQPETVEEALSLLASCGPDARLLAGGTVLMNQMRGKKVAPRHVINISRVADLDRITGASRPLVIEQLATDKPAHAKARAAAKARRTRSVSTPAPAETGRYSGTP